METCRAEKSCQFAIDFMSAFAVSKIRLDVDGRVTQVVWGIIDRKSMRWVSAEALIPVADVAEAIHKEDQVLAVFPGRDNGLPKREFVVVEFDDGTETIELDEVTGPALRIRDMDRIAQLG